MLKCLSKPNVDEFVEYELSYPIGWDRDLAQPLWRATERYPPEVEGVPML